MENNKRLSKAHPELDSLEVLKLSGLYGLPT